MWEREGDGRTDLVEADDVGVREQLERGDLAAYLVVDALRHDAGAVQDLDGELGAAAAVPRLLHLPEVALPERPPQLVRAQQPARAAAAHHVRGGRSGSDGAALRGHLARRDSWTSILPSDGWNTGQGISGMVDQLISGMGWNTGQGICRAARRAGRSRRWSRGGEGGEGDWEKETPSYL